MNDPFYDRLREISWKRPLKPDEEAALRAWLRDNPQTGADWESDARLTNALRELANAPVPSNFTSRVLQAIDRDERARQPRKQVRWWRRVFLPRTAIAVTLVGLGLVVHQHHKESRRAEIGRQVVAVSSVAALSKPELLLNLETIRHLGPPDISADEELIALLTLPQ